MVTVTQDDITHGDKHLWVQKFVNLGEQVDKAVDLAVQYGGIDGAHHKAWVIDQMVRVLAGDNYDSVVAKAKAGEDGPETYEWDVGIPP